MWTVIGTIGVVLVTVVLGVLADRKWGLVPSPERLRAAGAPKPLPGHAAGEAPSTALRVTAAELARLATAQRCPRCRATMHAAGDEPVMFDGRELRVLAFRCPRCDGARSIYVDVVS
jgi:hypothetical protein